MKKVMITMLVIILALSGCSKGIKPKKVIKTDFDLQEAEFIMKRVWKPVHEMTNSNLETRPDIPISTKEEFFEKYDFSYMDKSSMADNIYDSIVDFEDNKEVRDEKGNLVFREGNSATYIPTIYDKGIEIKEAYLRESIYNEKYSYNNKIELVVIEVNNDEIDYHALDFYRENVFRQNKKGEWILHHIQGTMCYSWDR